MIAVCNLCARSGDEEEPFRVPWDTVGEALMRAHLEDKHPEEKLPSPKEHR